MRLRISKYYQSWKDTTNNKVTIVPKNINNKIQTHIKNYTPWPEDCAVKKYKFHANPIKHYRKQYSNVNSSISTFSKLSLIGALDKPGGIINSLISENDCNTLNADSNMNIINHFNVYDINNDCTNGSCPAALLIKRASTVIRDNVKRAKDVKKIDAPVIINNYSASHREYIYYKCKTFKQNLPAQYSSLNIVNGTFITTCNDVTRCVNFTPSNKKFQTQGPVSSSARTHSLKYDCVDGSSCNKKVTINNCPTDKSLLECASLKKLLNNPTPVCAGCINDPSKIRRKRINILK
jgi:hypothetical protein